MNKIALPVFFSLIGFIKCYAQDLSFSDSTFLKAVLRHVPVVDLNNDGIIQQGEAEQVRKLTLMNQHLTSIEDVRFFPNIKELIVTSNDIVSTKLQHLDSLESFYIAKNQLISLELEDLPSLRDIGCGKNFLKEVSLKDLPNLESFNGMDNQLTVINVQPFKKLKYLNVDGNKLKKLDVSQNPELIQIKVIENDLKTLNIRSNTKLRVDWLYIDEDVELIGTPEQLKGRPAKKLINSPR